MRSCGRFYRREVIFTVWVLGGVGLGTQSCSPAVGGIQTESDGSSGGGGRAGADSTVDVNTGGMGGAPAPDSGDGMADVNSNGGAGGSPECIYHTDPPTTSALLQGGSSDDATGDASTADAVSLDVTVFDGQPDDAPVGDTGGGGPMDVASDRAPRDGASGAADAGPTTSITVETSPFVGKYLADSAGRTLYTFGNDQPGDCMNAPNTDCVADCLTAWPAFDAGQRTLPSMFSDAAFGSITRADGITFTTYYGWPLYYYRSDIAKGAVTGHGKSKTWHIATVLPASTVIMRRGTEPRYVADGSGRTLYSFDQDTKGTATDYPVSKCVGSCLEAYRPYERKSISVVSSLEATDFTIFIRPDTGTPQLAYKGGPLYLAVADNRSGDQNGLTPGWSLVAAP